MEQQNPQPPQFNKLLQRIAGEKPVGDDVALANLMVEYGCVADIIGRDYEVRDPKGKLLCTIRQKPMLISQMNALNQMLTALAEEQKRQSEKNKKKGRRK